MSKSGRHGRLNNGKKPRPAGGPGNHRATGRRKGEKSAAMLRQYRKS